MQCPACLARVLESDDKIDSFHEDCYIKWIAELDAELDGKVAKVRAKKASA